jgi:NADP-dependent 3-hydroxy acid dehydrogenase YdfG
MRKSMPTIRDKAVVITGSIRGFGYTIAESMLEAGALVAFTGRSRETIEGAIVTLHLKDA